MRSPLIIAGGGLAGCLAALALAERRPDQPILLVEAGESFGGNHIWSFFDSDIPPEHEWLTEMLGAKRWSSHDLCFPKRRRRLGTAYNSLSSRDLDALVRARLRPDQYRLGKAIESLDADGVTLAGGERLQAAAMLDARGAAPVEGPRLAWQKFLGLTRRFERPHGVERPLVMDACVDQSFGYRFVYLLPFSATELLVENTYYSSDPAVDAPRLRREIMDYADRSGWGAATVEGEEIGVLPILLSARLDEWWPVDDGIARLGLRGGFFHPTTGYSLPDAIANAALLTEQPILSSEPLHAFFRERARRLWDSRGFYRLLNRMMFEAAGPRRRYKVLEHFYRLPEPIIERFYAGRTTALDKIRILSGRPPVPLGAALAAARSGR
jgi:lycopene beta-cyclase